jgi:Putative zinc-finger
MIQTMDCGEARVSLGAYALGSIDPAERALVNAHLATCRDCRDELAGLAGLPALLARVTAAEATALAEDHPEDGKPGEDGEAETGPRAAPGDGQPPRELLGTVLDLTAARRRRRRWRTVGLSAAAAVIVAAAAFGGAEVAAGHGTTSSPPQAAGLDYGNPVSGWTTVHGTEAGMYGTVMYRQMGWGTQVAAKVVGVPVDTPCRLIAVGPGGAQTVIGGWTTDTAEGTIWYPASSGLSGEQVREFQITVTGHKTIVIPA